MTVSDFIAKWRTHELKERASAQEHFIDLCHLVGHPTPVGADPSGTWFTFERGVTTALGGDGWADVWKKEFFGWEYKGKHKDLDAAYLQLLRYQGALENPPLLVTCDTDRIVIHTHFPNTPTQIIELTLEGLVEDKQLETLRWVFHDPERLRPGKTTQKITEEAASHFSDVAQALRGRDVPAQAVARFLDRVVFCLFAEDVGLLPRNLFTHVIENSQGSPSRFKTMVGGLFGAMAEGGFFGADRISHFNGSLFADATVLDLTVDELKLLLGVTAMDWSNIDASIFGTLFERALDPDKRSQLGAHYTSREDIETIVDPVVMAPLRREWADVRARFDALAAGQLTPARRKEASGLVRTFLHRLADVSVLDPACGSGNFLFVTLQKLKDLEKEAIIHASSLFPFLPAVGPWQLHGIELNKYAHELAQMTIWIGYLQWVKKNGFGEPAEPILRALTSFECKDAVLDLQPEAVVVEPLWPAAEFIVSNPPFLGVRKMRDNLGDEYVEGLFTLWDGRVPAEADYCCYWFEKARAQVAAGKTRRVGLLATQGIRAGASREVLRQIQETGNIFFAVSDRDWILDGATVHVSMVGFDDGMQKERILDGAPVTGSINPDLTTGANVTTAARLSANAGISFMGDTKVGPFDIPIARALEMLHKPNSHGQPNSDVLRPWVNGLDITRRARDMWIIDFPPGMSLADAAPYEAPFEYIDEHVRPMRAKARSGDATGVPWWIHQRPRPDMRQALAPLGRYLATPNVTKHRLFVWVQPEVLADHQLIAFAVEDDYTFGVLHSKVHETWARASGSQLRDEESGFRYTPTSTFETFPFVEVSSVQRQAITAAARALDVSRSRWLSPPEWLREEKLTFPATSNGPWAHLVEHVGTEGVGTARYVRFVPVDDDAAKSLKKRTLTKLYNERPTWLQDLHRALDEAVLAGYGLPADVSDERILSHLLALNIERAGTDVISQ